MFYWHLVVFDIIQWERERGIERERERRFKQAYKRLTSDGNYLIDWIWR